VRLSERKRGVDVMDGRWGYKFSIKPRLVFGTAGSATKRRVPNPLRFWQRVGYATAGIEICGIPPFAKNAKDGAPGDLLRCREQEMPRFMPRRSATPVAAPGSSG
jgi:hypothetical protein